ncbi:DUF58 domain-containing protein [Haloferacaceae archaeon DSL9]
MHPTRRTTATAGLAIVIAGLSILVARPALTVGAAALLAWLLAHQLAAVRAFRATVDALEIDVDPAATTVATDRPVQLVLSVRRPRGRAADTTLAVSLPDAVGFDLPASENRTVALEPGETRGECVVEVSLPVAGRFSIPRPTVTLADAADTVTESLDLGPTPEITAEPPTPTRIHVGAGGRTFPASYGDFVTEQTGSGTTPAELREYFTGDPAHLIDWKTTARLGSPYVREFEANADRRIVLLVDRRASTAVGPEGRTAFAYLRAVALGISHRAERESEPLGLVTVDDAGVQTVQLPTAAPQHYARIRRRLHDCRPTPTEGIARESSTSPTRRTRAAAALAGDDGEFGRTLAPYFSSIAAVERVADDPRYAAMRRIRERVGGMRLTIILTDDTDRTELRETVRLATENGGHALVMLAPQVLFASDALADIDAAYDRYADFEAFRADLDRLPRVSAFEVGPGDRLEAVLSAHRPPDETPRNPHLST